MRKPKTEFNQKRIFKGIKATIELNIIVFMEQDQTTVWNCLSEIQLTSNPESYFQLTNFRIFP